MALWRDDSPTIELETRDLVLRAPRAEDYEAWAKLRAASRRHTEPWEPSWTEDELTRTAYRGRLRRYDLDWKEGRGAPFFVIRKRGNLLIGACNLNNIKRGVMQSADIGYWIGAPYVRQGYARQAVRRVLAFAFSELHLNRIEAAVQPANTVSRALLEEIGFQHEGLARRLLFIAGEWRDHDRLALLAGDPIRG
ncbi:GNAT family N-acetyltransferase [Hyphobacterium indicum]|uniref:GNAT family N-acetyltransferase n=1 Tax=Hyphobacterium indicum TaxID=2162714 RepID=UPI000D65AC6D|nr:GNAT family protein [Hyphobacterium indicum]